MRNKYVFFICANRSIRSGSLSWFEGRKRKGEDNAEAQRKRRVVFIEGWQTEEGKDGARKRTRTSTTVRPLAPEASASANSAIRALQQ